MASSEKCQICETSTQVPDKNSRGNMSANRSPKSYPWLCPKIPDLDVYSPLLPLTKPTDDLYILICMQLGDKIAYTQINVAEPMTDAQFFSCLRAEYKHLSGWRYYFGFSQFESCGFAQFTSYSVNTLFMKSDPINPRFESGEDGEAQASIYDCKGIGERDNYPTPTWPNIERAEWFSRFHGNVETGRQFLSLMPKRKSRFEMERHSGRESCWGLEIYRDVSLWIWFEATVIILTLGLFVLPAGITFVLFYSS